MIAALLSIAVFLLSVLLTAAMLQFAEQTRLLAHPSERSSHSTPTPVGGGVALVFGYGVGIVFLTLEQHLQASELLVLCMSLPIAVTGFIDDRSELNYRVRLSVQIAAVAAVFLLLGPMPAMNFGPFALSGVLLSFVIAPLCLLWLSNLYNFMDGIDGLAGTQAAFVSLVAAFMLAQAGDMALGVLCLFIFAASSGFMVWNWPRARIFMGDVGSGFIGMSLGLIALLSHYHGSMSLWSWFILLSVFVVDATTTLVRRVLAGQPWAHAHRQHAYQHMADCAGAHKKVVLSVLVINTVYLLPLAFFAGKHPEYGVYFTLLGVIPLAVLAIRCGAGKESQGQSIATLLRKAR